MFGRHTYKKRNTRDIDPDEIFLDSKNLPQFDVDQFEGRLEKPIGRNAVLLFSVGLICIGILLITKISFLQIVHGETYREKSEQNRLDNTLIFAERGIIYDRNTVALAWNQSLIASSSPTSTSTSMRIATTTGENSIPRRTYIDKPGFAHILGFISYPQKDTQGIYYQNATHGRDGMEKVYDSLLSGVPGKKIIERNAIGERISESVIELPQKGQSLVLTLDSRIQEQLYTSIENLAQDVGFSGGAGVILDVKDGGVLALASYPSYDSQVMTDGDDAQTIASYTTDGRTPFLNRAIAGLYTPGSIMKPFFALGALAEHIIDPETTIFSDGALEVPNPYNPELPTVFKDWKAHGAVDMRRALAVSSNIYFFHIGGGFGTQRGLGIENLEKYVRMFGIPKKTEIDLLGELDGVVPNKAWKKEHFPDDPWRIGDTYNSSIGQYGFQVTPIQMARAAAAIANNGTIITPHLKASNDAHKGSAIALDDSYLQIIKEGMRMAVTEGTAVALNLPQTSIAAKSGTAELGSAKQRVNSWIIGFWPYESPRYAFAVVMERGPATNVIGSAYVMRNVFDWIIAHAPEYL